MPSFLELIITAVGTETAAASVGKVNGALGDMVGELGRVAVAALSVQTAYQGVSSAIGEAAEFEHLSMRTGESVRELVVLDQAFRNAHLGAEMIGMSANMLQRSLGGLNDMGGKTDGAFKRIGTSIAELKPLTYAQQLEVLSKGFANLSNQADKVAVARQLFGRGGGSMLQLLGDPEALELAKQQTGDLATRVDQNARAAENLEKQWNGVTAQIRTMWQAAATQLLPTLQSVASVMGGIGGAGSLGAGLAGMAPSLLGAGLAAGIIPKLDNAVLDWATRTGNPAGQAFAGKFIAPITGAMSSMLLPALAAVIAGGIVAGILNAMADANVQATLRDLHVVGDAMKGARDRAGKSGSPEEIAAARAATQAEMTKLLLEQSVLEKRKTAAEAEAKAAAGLTTTYGVGMSVSFRPKAFSDADAKRLQDVKEIIGEQKLLMRDLGDPAKAAKIVSDAQLAKLKDTLSPLVGQLPEMQKKHEQLLVAAGDPDAELKHLRAELAAKQAELAKPLPGGLSDDEIAAHTLQLENQILELKKDEHEVTQKIAAAAKHAEQEQIHREAFELETQAARAAAAGNSDLANQLKEQAKVKQAMGTYDGIDLNLAKQRIDAEHMVWEQQEAQRKAHEQTAAQRTALENQMTAIRENIANLEADYTRTDAEKWTERKAAIAQEIATLQAAIAADQLAAQAAHAAGHPGAASTFEASAAAKGQQLGSMQGEAGRMGPSPNDPFAQMRESLTQLRNEGGTTAQQIGHSLSSIIGGGMQAVSSQITTAITRTGDWRQAFANIGLAIEESVVGALVQLGVQMAINYALGKLIRADEKKDTKEAVVEKGAEAGMKSIAQLGPIWGTVAFAVSAAAVLALASSFESGGYTGGSEGQPAGIVHGQEYVFSAPAVRNMGGSAAVAAMHSAALRPASAPGASSGLSAGRSAPPNVHIYLDKSAYLAAIAGDMTGIAHQVYDKRQRS
jgi:hypothetical protein